MTRLQYFFTLMHPFFSPVTEPYVLWSTQQLKLICAHYHFCQTSPFISGFHTIKMGFSCIQVFYSTCHMGYLTLTKSNRYVLITKLITYMDLNHYINLLNLICVIINVFLMVGYYSMIVSNEDKIRFNRFVSLFIILE